MDGAGVTQSARRCDVEGCDRPAAPSRKKCMAHFQAISRHGVVPEVAYARLLSTAYRLADVDTGDDRDGEFEATLAEFHEAFLVAAKVWFPLRGYVSTPPRRIRGK